MTTPAPRVTSARALVHGFRHYADFNGQDKRAVFWKFIGVTQLALVALLLPGIVVCIQCWQAMVEDERVLDSVVFLLQAPSAASLRELGQAAYGSAMQFFSRPEVDFSFVAVCCILAVGWALMIALPTLSAMVRRLRDAGKSPWWALPPCLAFVPLPGIMDIGMLLSIVTLVYCSLESAPSLPPVPEQRFS